MPHTPSEENAQEVMNLLECGAIPNFELVNLITKYGHGDSLITYWEGYLPSNGLDVLEQVRCCYRKTSDVQATELARPYAHLVHLLCQGLMCLTEYRVVIGEPVIYGVKDAALLKEPHTDMVRLDLFLRRYLHKTDPQVHFLKEFDPWLPVCTRAKHEEVWFSLPRDLGDPDKTYVFQVQRTVLTALMQWIASYARVDQESRVVELRHLVELIVEYRNLLWGMKRYGNGSEHIYRPVIIAQKTTTLPTGVSSKVPTLATRL